MYIRGIEFALYTVHREHAYCGPAREDYLLVGV